MEVASSAFLGRPHPPSTHGRINNYAASHQSLMHTQSFQSQSSSSQYSTYSAYSRSSASTVPTSVSTLGPPSMSTPPIPSNGGPLVATNNVLNSRAGQESSLFQMCITLRNRLRRVPEFEE